MPAVPTFTGTPEPVLAISHAPLDHHAPSWAGPDPRHPRRLPAAQAL